MNDSYTEKMLELKSISLVLDTKAGDSDYDRGIANGLRMALSVINGTDPSYFSSDESDHEDELIGIVEVAEILGVGRATVWRWVKKGKLQEPMKLSEQTRRWKRSDIIRKKKTGYPIGKLHHQAIS